MKYVFIIPLWILLFILSMLLGGIMYLWKFSKKDFYKGTTYLNGKISFSDWLFKN